MKTGDYIRTKKGYIRKIIIEPNFYRDNVFVDTHTHFKKTDIVKSSPKIIDLIEVGDYVNGVRVDEIIYIGHGTIKDLEISFRYKYAFEKDDVYTLKEQDIKSIVTKQQFESMEYKIGE